MVQDQGQTAQRNESADEGGGERLSRYVIDLECAQDSHRALAMLVASRRCYPCQQADDQAPSPSSDAQVYIDRIAEHCGQTSDYLLPDTPLKEAIFRVILAGGNQPMTAEEISDSLSEKWAMTPYPRNISSAVVQRLMDRSDSYCIVRLPEPETEGRETSADPPTGSPAEDSPEIAS